MLSLIINEKCNNYGNIIEVIIIGICPNCFICNCYIVKCFINWRANRIIVYSCMIKRVSSIRSVLWIIIGMMTLANIPLNWGAMMLCTVSRHFQNESDGQD